MNKDMVSTSLIGMEDLARAWSDVDSKIRELKWQIKILERSKENLESGFKNRMENADLGTLSGYEVRYKRSSQKRFNSAKFKADHPEEYSAYLEEKPFRRFEIVRTAIPEPPKEEAFSF